MYIDHNYCRTVQLFEEDAVDGYFPVTPNRPTRPKSPDLGQDNPRPDVHTVFDGNKAAIWLKKLSQVLPLFITHHRTHLGCIYDIRLNHFLLLSPGGGNISRITEAKYRNVLRAYTRFLGDLGILVGTVHPLNTSKNPISAVHKASRNSV
jgi:hypothetical protein